VDASVEIPSLTPEDRLTRDRIAALYAGGWGMTLANLAAVIGVVVLLWDQMPPAVAGGWLATIGLLMVSRAIVLARYRKVAQERHAPRRWGDIFAAGSLISGCAWGLAIGAIAVQAEPWALAVAIGVGVGVGMAIGTADTAVYPPALWAYATSLAVLVAIALVWRGDAIGLDLAVLVALIYGAGLLLARHFGRVVVDALRLRRDNADLIERLIVARQQAEAATHAKTQFLASISHELRTPLNAIIGFSEIIAKNANGPDTQRVHEEYAGYINASGVHLLKLVDNILDLAKYADGQFELVEAPIELAALVRACVNIVAVQAQRKKVEIGVEIAEGFPRFMADELRLKQALLNLVSNAVKFSTEGGAVTISAQLGSAQLGERRDLAIAVADTGIGMRREDIPAALEPFRQIAPALSRAHDGTGLGLPLAKMLVEKHGGTLAVESEPGIGTTVTVMLPGSRACDDPPGAGAPGAGRTIPAAATAAIGV
jgi:signal transduction histidine kinase